MIRCEGYMPRPLGAELRVCTLSQIPYENNQPRCLRRGWLINFSEILKANPNGGNHGQA
jgi:hypothetical protein